jgi:hypothetical protein
MNAKRIANRVGSSDHSTGKNETGGCWSAAGSKFAMILKS